MTDKEKAHWTEFGTYGDKLIPELSKEELLEWVSVFRNSMHSIIYDLLDSVDKDSDIYKQIDCLCHYAGRQQSFLTMYNKQLAKEQEE